MARLHRGERLHTAMPGVYVDHNDARNPAGDDSQIGSGPALVPSCQLLLGRHLVLEALPADDRSLRALAGRHHRPAMLQIAKGGFKVRAVAVYVIPAFVHLLP